MKEKIALDTNVVIDVFNNRQNTITLLNTFQTIYLPITVCGELMFGAKNSAKSQENEQKCHHKSAWSRFAFTQRVHGRDSHA